MEVQKKVERYSSEDEYIAELKRRSVLPEGFSAGSVGLSFQPAEMETPGPRTMYLSGLVLDEPTELFAGTLTRSFFAGAPIMIARSRLKAKCVRGILINNSIANVCTKSGVEDAQELLNAFASEIGGSGEEYLAASTGVIGWRLPVGQMKSAIPDLGKALNRETIVDVARGIMTTDRFPKVRAAAVGDTKIVAIAKGAGMIEPNMATLLVFVLTDAAVEKEKLNAFHRTAIEESFNRISVDSDQSTSDMAIILSSGRKPVSDEDGFRNALVSVCRDLAEDVVRNGEGTGHVIRTVVQGAADEAFAAAMGKAIINSPLVKTAAFGNDPNVGRIIMAVGDFLGASGKTVDPDAITIAIGGQTVFRDGSFSLDSKKEELIFNHMKEAQLHPDEGSFPAHNRRIEIELDLGSGNGAAAVLGSDLSYGYVRENADYRT